MGTEALSYALFDQPGAGARHHGVPRRLPDRGRPPVLEKTTVEYVCFNEDLSMKTGPLISPKAYRTFIFPRLKRVIEFYKSHGCRYVAIDTDGNPEAVVPLFMDAGVDILWPLERASDQDPVRLRKKFGKSLRLWGGVDKRILAEGPEAIDAHLRTMLPTDRGGRLHPDRRPHRPART